MLSTSHIARRPGSVIVNLTDDDCPHCVHALATGAGASAPLTERFGSCTVVTVMDCPQSHLSARVTSDDGRYGITFRTRKGEDRSLVFTFANLTVSAMQPEAAAALLGVVADLPAWGVTENMSDAAAVARLRVAVGWCMSPLSTEMDRWVKLGVTNALDAPYWADTGIAEEQIAAWVRCGVTNPQDAADFVAGGKAPSDVPAGATSPGPIVFVKVADVPAQWADLWMLVSPGFARIGFRQGQPKDTVHRLGHAVDVARFDGRGVGPSADNPPVKYKADGLTLESQWGREEERVYEAFAANLDGLNWDDASTCLAAGMSFAETVEHLREGRDMGPVKVLAGLTR